MARLAARSVLKALTRMKPDRQHAPHVRLAPLNRTTTVLLANCVDSVGMHTGLETQTQLAHNARKANMQTLGGLLPAKRVTEARIKTGLANLPAPPASLEAMQTRRGRHRIVSFAGQGHTRLAMVRTPGARNVTLGNINLRRGRLDALAAMSASTARTQVKRRATHHQRGTCLTKHKLQLLPASLAPTHPVETTACVCRVQWATVCLVRVLGCA